MVQKDFRQKFEENYLKESDSGKVSLTETPKSDFRAGFETRYGYDELFKKEREALKANREGKKDQQNANLRHHLETANDYFHAVESGRRRQTLFWDNPKIQQQIRQETGPSIYDLMDEREKERYFYEIGKNGNAAGSAYLDEITPKLQKLAYEASTKKAYDEAKDNSLVGLANNVVASLGIGAGYLDDAFRTALGKEINPYSIGHTLSGVEEVSRQALKENARENIADSAVTDFFVDTGLSMAQNMARMPLSALWGPAGMAVAGLGAATKGSEDARERGATKMQSLLSGGAQGLAEGAMEGLDFSRLKLLKEVPIYTWKDAVKNAGKHAGTEAVEEGLTELANTVADRIIMGDKSNWSMTRTKYEEEGYGEMSSFGRTLGDMAGNMALSALGGAISGGVMGGTVTGINTMNQERLGRVTNISNYREIADGIETDRGWYQNEESYQKAMELKEEAEALAERQEKGEEFTDLERGKFVQDYWDYWRAIEREQEIAPVQENSAQMEDDTKTLENKNEPSKNVTVTEENAIETQKNTSNQSKTAMNTDDDSYGAKLGDFGQKAWRDNYNSNTAIDDYSRAFNRYYDAGRHNIEMSVAERAAISSILTSEQAEAAYKAGMQDRNAAAGLLDKAGRYIKGNAKTGSVTDLSGRASEAQMNVANIVGKKTGLKIELVDGKDNVGGSYGRESGTIRISVDSDNFLQTTSHELTHFIKDYARSEYEVYADICVRALMNSDKISYDEVVRQYEDKYMETGAEMTRDEIMEEIVSDATGRFLNDEEFVNKITKENRTVAQKIVDFISDMIDSIKQLMTAKNTTKVANALREQLDYYEEARDVWAHGLESAGERYRSGEELANAKGERFMLKNPDEVTEDKIEKNFNYVRNMDPVVALKGDEFLGREKKLADQIVEYYDSLGNIVHNDVIGDIILNKRAMKDDVAHGIGQLKAITFKAVPQVLEKGRVLQFRENWKDRGYDSIIVGAKINIESGKFAGDYYEICVVNIRENNRLYLHEVHTVKMDDQSLFKTGVVDNNGGPGRVGHPLISSIFEKLTNVNGGTKKNPPATEGVQASSLTSKTVSGTDSNKGLSTAADEKTSVRTSETTSGRALDLSIDEKQREVNGGKVRFQLQDVDGSTDIESLAAENEELKKLNKRLEEELKAVKANAPTKAEVERIASKILKQYHSEYDEMALNENLQKLYNHIKTSDRINVDEIIEAATSIGRSVAMNAEKIDKTVAEGYEGVAKYLRKTKIKVPESLRNEFESFGGYEKFRRKYFGRIALSKDGIDIDTAYMELRELYGDMFDENIINPADQLKEMARVADSARPIKYNPYHADIDEISYIIGQEIFQEYVDRVTSNQMKDHYRTQLNKYKTQLRMQYETELDEAQIEFGKKLVALRKKAKEAVKTDKAEYKKIQAEIHEMENNKEFMIDEIIGKMKFQRKRDAEAGRRYKAQIIRDVNDMAKWLEKPTDKNHVPESLRKFLAEFLSNIDYSSNRKNPDGSETRRTEEWFRLKDLFAKIMDAGGVEEDGTFYSMEIDTKLINNLELLANMKKGMDRLEDLEPAELKRLREVVISMKACLRTINMLYENENYKRVEEAGTAFLNENKKRATKTIYAGKLGTAQKLIQTDMLDAQTFFGQMGQAMKSLYNELRTAQDEKIRHTKEGQEYFQKLLSDCKVSRKEFMSWGGRNAKRYSFEGKNGATIELTTRQIMSLYALSQRPQAREHLKVGGITNSPNEVKQKGKIGFVIEQNPEPISVDMELIGEMTNVLTPQQKAIMHGMVKFFTTVTAEWGNNVSMRQFGYKKFMDKFYYPIVVNRNYTPTNEENIEGGTPMLKNYGFTKRTKPDAKTPVIIEDCFDVYLRQVDQMGSYAAFVIPLSDVQKVLNFRNKDAGVVKDTMSRVYGKVAEKYIESLMRDINGASKGEASLSTGFVRNMKIASVGANLRTAIQQPTSFVRAAMEIDVKYLAEGLATSSKDWDKAMEYAPIVWWKSQGYFDVSTGRTMEQILAGPTTLIEKSQDWSMVLAEKGDKFTWKHLWEAVKAETRDKHSELKEGSEEFYKQAGKRLTEIVDRTQVVDSVLHRSKVMKSKDGLTQMVTSFMSEPTKTYNMIYRSLAECRLNNSKENRAKVRKTACVYAASGIATALAAAVIDAMRDKEDKPWADKYKEAAWENIKDNLNPIGIIPWFKDAVSIFQGYDVKRTDMQAIQQLYWATQKVMKYANGESDLTIAGLMGEIAKPISTMFGIPIGNALKDLDALAETLISHTFDSPSALFDKRKITNTIKSTKNLKDNVGLAIRAIYKGDEETAKRIFAELEAAGIDDSDVEEKYVAALKEDIRTIHAAEARGKGRMKEYESLANELIKEGFDRDYVLKAISGIGSSLKTSTKEIKGFRSSEETEKADEKKDELLEQGFSDEYIENAIEKLPEEIEEEEEPESMYSWSDMDLALDISKEDFNLVVERICEEKKALDWDDKKIRTTAKQWFTTKYKPLYQYGTDAERKAIRTKLYSIKIKGKKLYEDSTVFSDWMEDKKKK